MIVRAPIKTTEQHFRLSCIDWPTYVAMGKLFQDRPIRMNYDCGELELMTVSSIHERYKCGVRRLFETLTEELDVNIVNGGSMTFQREDLEKGMEPDECWWIQNEQVVRGKSEIDFAMDPPPDLVMEIEISCSIMNRLRILAALGVREVWRFDGDVLLLNEQGQYVESARSAILPFFSLQELVRFAALQFELGDTQMVKQFRFWVREQIAAGWPSAPTTDPNPQP